MLQGSEGQKFVRHLSQQSEEYCKAVTGKKVCSPRRDLTRAAEFPIFGSSAQNFPAYTRFWTSLENPGISRKNFPGKFYLEKIGTIED